MALYTTEQAAAITTAEVALTVLRGLVTEATAILTNLRDLEWRPFLDGNLDGTGAFNTAVAEWAALMPSVKAAANNLP